MNARWLAIAVTAVIFSSCQASDGGGTRLTVYAATSLTEAFLEIADGFEAQRPDVQIATSFGGSQVLRLQIENGARADLFASANEEHLGALVDAGLAREQVRFASTELAVIAPNDAHGPTTFEDLATTQSIVLGSDNVPVGKYTALMFDRAGAELGPEFAAAVRGRVVSRETNVRLVRAKVELGAADAAVVYLTDALACDRVRQVPIPPAVNVPVHYAVGRIRGDQEAVAADFVVYLQSEEGREILRGYGFMTEDR